MSIFFQLLIRHFGNICDEVMDFLTGFMTGLTLPKTGQKSQNNSVWIPTNISLNHFTTRGMLLFLDALEILEIVKVLKPLISRDVDNDVIIRGPV